MGVCARKGDEQDVHEECTAEYAEVAAHTTGSICPRNIGYKTDNEDIICVPSSNVSPPGFSSGSAAVVTSFDAVSLSTSTSPFSFFASTGSSTDGLSVASAAGPWWRLREGMNLLSVEAMFS